MKCYECLEEGKDIDAVGTCYKCGINLCREHIDTCDICKKNVCKEHFEICNRCKGNFCEEHINYYYREERTDCCIWEVIDGINCDNCYVPPDNERPPC